MDLGLTALAGAAHLIGITFTLRRIYKPAFAVPEAMAAALSRLDRHAGGLPI